MLARYQHGSVTWVDLVSPTQEEVRALMEEFGLEPHVAEELLTPTMRSSVDVYGAYIYLVLHFPAFKHTHTVASRPQEVDFIVGDEWLITTRYDTIDPLHRFAKIFEVNSVLDKSDFGKHASNVFFAMLMKIYQSLSDELDYIGDRLEEAEDAIFGGAEKEMVVELSNIGRDILNFKQALAPHTDVLESLAETRDTFFGNESEQNMERVSSDYFRLRNHLEGHNASLCELRETNNALLTTKQNEIMKLFTILAFVTFPLSLFTSIFGMNTQALPLVGHPYDFWIIIGIMVAATVMFFAFFKYKNWL